MKRSLILSFAVALLAPFALLGCGEETKEGTKTTTTTTNPDGSKKTDKDEKSTTVTEPAK